MKPVTNAVGHVDGCADDLKHFVFEQQLLIRVHWCSFVVELLQPLAEHRQAIVRARDHLHADDRADLRSGSGTGVRRGFHARHVAAEKRGHVAASRFFPSP